MTLWYNIYTPKDLINKLIKEIKVKLLKPINHKKVNNFEVDEKPIVVVPYVKGLFGIR